MAPKPTTKTGLTSLQQAMEALDRSKIERDSYYVTIDDSQLTRSAPCIPSGSIIVDHLIGGKKNERGVAPCPGFPRGRISLIYGSHSCGKTTLALTTAATTCAMGGTVAYIDFENEVNLHYAQTLGVPILDSSRFMLAQPETLEDGIAIMLAVAKAGVDLIVVDSIGAGVTKAQSEKSLKDRAEGKDARIGAAARAWSDALPEIKKNAAQVVKDSDGARGSAIIGISQLRDKIGGMAAYGGDNTQIQGGHAWKYYASVMLKLSRIKKLTEKQHDSVNHVVDDMATGALVKMVLDKNKVSSTMQQHQCFYLRHGTGIDDLSSLIAIGQAYGVIKRKGPWYIWDRPAGEVRSQGLTAFYRTIAGDDEAFDELHRTVVPYLAMQGDAGSLVETVEDLDLSGTVDDALDTGMVGDVASEVLASLDDAEDAKS